MNVRSREPGGARQRVRTQIRGEYGRVPGVVRGSDEVGAGRGRGGHARVAAGPGRRQRGRDLLGRLLVRDQERRRRPEIWVVQFRLSDLRLFADFSNPRNKRIKT